jgi:hypothetical protein
MALGFSSTGASPRNEVRHSSVPYATARSSGAFGAISVWQNTECQDLLHRAGGVRGCISAAWLRSDSGSQSWANVIIGRFGFGFAPFKADGPDGLPRLRRR